MAAVERDLFGVCDDARVNVSQVAVRNLTDQCKKVIKQVWIGRTIFSTVEWLTRLTRCDLPLRLRACRTWVTQSA